MIVRKAEYCPRCGQYDPWRKGRSGKSWVHLGERFRTVECRRCGMKEVIRYAETRKKVPNGDISSL